LNFAHRLFLKLSSQGDSGFDVFLLVRFFATSEQDNDLGTPQDKLNPVARPEMNSHFGDTFANGRAIAKVAILSPINANLDAPRRLLVA